MNKINLDVILKARGNTYGEFRDNARISQGIKSAMRVGNWDTLPNVQREALEMIAHKMARILAGDPAYADNMVDIAGYATLVAEEINYLETI
jgi:hypothetical protein